MDNFSLVSSVCPKEGNSVQSLTDGRAGGHTNTWLPKFLGWIYNHFFSCKAALALVELPYKGVFD